MLQVQQRPEELHLWERSSCRKRRIKRACSRDWNKWSNMMLSHSYSTCRNLQQKTEGWSEVQELRYGSDGRRLGSERENQCEDLISLFASLGSRSHHHASVVPVGLPQLSSHGKRWPYSVPGVSLSPGELACWAAASVRAAAKFRRGRVGQSLKR
jgi:hypothetical protein